MLAKRPHGLWIKSEPQRSRQASTGVLTCLLAAWCILIAGLWAASQFGTTVYLTSVIAGLPALLLLSCATWRRIWQAHKTFVVEINESTIVLHTFDHRSKTVEVTPIVNDEVILAERHRKRGDSRLLICTRTNHIEIPLSAMGKNEADILESVRTKGIPIKEVIAS